MAQYINFYECPCGHEWEDQWSAMCDDDCPACGTTCSPSESEDLLPDGMDADVYFRRAGEKWKDMPLKERIQLCAKHGASIFASRDENDIPDVDDDAIVDALMENA